MAGKNAVAYWLTPARPELELFRKLISILAAELGAAKFEPHLTLAVRSDLHSPGVLLKKVTAGPVRLRISEVGYSEKFTKTLFVRFQPAAALAKIAAQVSVKAKPISDPHLSLLYKKLPGPTRRELASAIRLPFRAVTFDAIKAVRCAIPTESRADVESWEIVERKRLSR